jgi:Hydantoinase B/oxoprolinase
MKPMPLDPVTLAVIENGLKQVCSEMDLVHEKTSFSPVISEAYDRSNGIKLEHCQLKSALDLPLCFGFHQSPLGRIVVERAKWITCLPGAQFEPILPNLLDREVRPCLFNGTTKRLEDFQRTLAQIEHARLKWQISAEIAQPGYAGALKIALEPVRILRRVLSNR